MFPSRFLAQVAVSFVLVLRANAEQHSIKFDNQCGYGTPALMQNGVNILSGDVYTNGGPWSGIAYLQTGYCNTNGENCTLLETTLIDPTPGCVGCGSSTDISLIPPHAYNVETSFAYYDGCDGQGKMCTNADCTDAAFFSSNDNQVQVACQSNEVNLLIAFCANASQIVLDGGASGTTTGSSSSPTSSLPTMTSSLPPSTLPPPSNTPSLGSSTPGSVPPVTPSMTSTPSTAAPTPTPTPTQTSTDDTGCGETEPTTPSSTPTPSEPATSAPTSTPTSSPASSPASLPASSPTSSLTSSPTSTPTPTPTIPANSAPPPASASASPTTTQSCRPRPTSLVPSNSAPTGPTSAHTFTPSTAPSATPSTSMPYAQLRRHRRTNRIRY